MYMLLLINDHYQQREMLQRNDKWIRYHPMLLIIVYLTLLIYLWNDTTEHAKNQLWLFNSVKQLLV